MKLVLTSKLNKYAREAVVGQYICNTKVPFLQNYFDSSEGFADAQCIRNPVNRSSGKHFNS